GKVTVFSTLPERVVFYNNTGGVQGGVYVTDGSGGFEQILPRRPVELDGEGTMFVVLNNTIYFVADDGVNGQELWKSDGSVAGTMMVDENFFPGSGGSNPRDLTVFNNTLFFSANTTGGSPTGDVGRELFSTNGFTISLEANIRSGNGDSSPEQLTVSGSNLYFTANDGSSGRELYAFASSTATQVEDIWSGGNGSDPQRLTDVNGVLYFSADDGSDGREPYRSQGAAGNTFQIANIAPGLTSSNPANFTAALGEVYFSADDATSGIELWKTTGAEGNATLVADINPGGADSDPVPRFDTGSRLLFTATSPTTTNQELWSVDQSATNLFQVRDLYPSDFFGSDPDEFVEINDVIYFAASDASSGRELFQLEQVAPVVSEVLVGGSGAPVAEVQRSSVDLVTLVFDGRVDVPASAVQLVNSDTGTTITSVVVNLRFENDQTFVDLTFGVGPSVIERDAGSTTGLRNSLADGNYQLTILANQVSSPVSGEAMANNFVFGADRADQFFRLFGDVDGDRDVDPSDFAAFRSTYRSVQGANGYESELDFLGDGTIDAGDFAEFRRRLNRSI
ncbi:MAG: dockerin type I domain-containing protein, partial [Planctomycetota bacterium]